MVRDVHPSHGTSDIKEVVLDDLQRELLGEAVLELGEAVTGKTGEDSVAHVGLVPECGRRHPLDHAAHGFMGDPVAVDAELEVVGDDLPPLGDLEAVLEGVVDAASGEGPPAGNAPV
jgi:hypothetical protein